MAPRLSRDERHLPPRRRLLVRILGALAVLLVVVFAYQALRAGLALRSAQDEARQLKQELAEGDQAAATRTLRTIAAQSRTARSHTDNVLWDGVALIPWLGDNVEAVQVISRVLDDTSRAALPPALRLSSALSSEELRSADGTFDVDRIAGLQPDFEQMEAASDQASQHLGDLGQLSLLALLRDASTTLDEQVHLMRSTARAGATVTRVMPALLGEEGPRTYLLVVQNNAEGRATGGLPGSFSILTASQGKVSLGPQTAALGRFPILASPISALSPGERLLYGDTMAEDVRDTNLTPDFPRTAQLMSAMLQRQTGQQVDGVISVDPVALSGVLRAIGPVQVGNDTFTSTNVVGKLLHEPYQELDTQVEQDAYFATVARGIFDGLLTQQVDQTAVVRSLAGAAGQRRLLLWSRHDDEQRELRPTPVSGALPTDAGSTPHVGMYLNDHTLAKMQYYLRSYGSLTSLSCTAAGAQTLKAGLVLESTAPEDVSGLSPFVTGVGARTPKGTMRMSLVVYAPTGGKVTEILANDEPVRLSTVEHDGHQVTVVGLLIEPGEKIRLTTTVQTRPGQESDPVASWTPGVRTSSSGVRAPSACS